MYRYWSNADRRMFLSGQRAWGVLPDPEAAIDRCSREAGLLGSLEQVEKGGGQYMYHSTVISEVVTS